MAIFKNRKEFKSIFSEWYNPLCNYAFSIVKNNQQAKDIVQDVFLQIWEQQDQHFIKTSLKSYLFKATYHKTLEKIRKSKRHQEVVSLSANGITNEVTMPDFQKDANLYRIKEEINNSIRQLPPKCQEVFLLSRKNGLTYTEIANDLGISKKTVENHMIKALDFLRNNLKNIISE